MAYTVNYNPTLRIPKTAELTWVELDDNFKNIKLELDAIQTETVTINADITALQLTVAALGGNATIPSVLNDLTDVSTISPTLGQVLAWNGTTWTPSTTSSTAVIPSFDKTTGVLTVSSGTVSNTTNFDGRYVRSVNGVTGDATGNVSLSITSTMTGTLAARPTTATSGIVYVVSGDVAANNGKTYIYVVPTGWQQVVSYDVATNDARYILKAGDTLTGPLTLAADPTSALQAATKQYVDTRQPLDGTLTALSGFNTNGFMVQTAADVFVGRSLTSDGTISITNPQGIIANPVFSLADGSVTTAKMNATTLVTSTETIATNNDDLKIPTTAAVKSYVDSTVATALTSQPGITYLGALTPVGAAGTYTLSGLNLTGYSQIQVWCNGIRSAFGTTLIGSVSVSGLSVGSGTTVAYSTFSLLDLASGRGYSLNGFNGSSTIATHTLTAASTSISVTSTQQFSAGSPGTIRFYGVK